MSRLRHATKSICEKAEAPIAATGKESSAGRALFPEETFLTAGADLDFLDLIFAGGQVHSMRLAAREVSEPNAKAQILMEVVQNRNL